MSNSFADSTVVNINHKEQTAIVLPAGYNPNDIIVIRPENNDNPVLPQAKMEPETVLDHL